jgi:hypothetical protein
MKPIPQITWPLQIVPSTESVPRISVYFISLALAGVKHKNMVYGDKKGNSES